MLAKQKIKNVSASCVRSEVRSASELRGIDRAETVEKFQTARRKGRSARMPRKIHRYRMTFAQVRGFRSRAAKFLPHTMNIYYDKKLKIFRAIYSDKRIIIKLFSVLQNLLVTQ